MLINNIVEFKKIGDIFRLSNRFDSIMNYNNYATKSDDSKLLLYPTSNNATSICFGRYSFDIRILLILIAYLIRISTILGQWIKIIFMEIFLCFLCTLELYYHDFGSHIRVPYYDIKNYGFVSI